LPVPRALALLGQVASALDAAHTAGVAYRAVRLERFSADPATGVVGCARYVAHRDGESRSGEVATKVVREHGVYLIDGSEVA